MYAFIIDTGVILKTVLIKNHFWISGGRKTEIIPVPSSRENSVGPKEQKPKTEQESERQQFYTDRYFSSNFLSDSIPLSQMLKRN